MSVYLGYLDIFRTLYLFAVDPKLMFEEALTFQELPDHGLTWGQVAILKGKPDLHFKYYHHHKGDLILAETIIMTLNNLDAWEVIFKTWLYHFNPCSANRKKLAFLDILLNLGEEAWVPALNPVELLGLKQGAG